MIRSSSALNLRLSEVGKTNHRHSEEERQLIRENIRDTEEVLQALNIEKRAVKLRKNVLESDLARYYIAIAPVKQLPCDVLYSIFKLHCQNHLPTNIPFRSMPPQLTLSQVCSAWRQAMLNSGKFWSNIEIVPRQRTLDKMLESASFWLSRANDSSCSVKFNWNSGTKTLWKQEWHQNIVKNFISRHKFKSISVAFAIHHLRDLLRLPDENLSCIEDFRLEYVNPSDSIDDSQLDFRKLVSLTSFTLLPNPFTGVDPVRIPKLSDFPWYQLRHIELHLVSAVFFSTVMEKSASVLETCSFIISDDSSSTPPPPYKPIQCSRLQNFTVHVSSSNAVKVLGPFLLSLRMPILKSLTLGSPKRFPIPVDAQTLMTQNISSVHLEELVISDTTSDTDAQVILTRFPLLRRLTLPTNIKFTAATIGELGAGSIGTNLEYLRIDNGDLDIIMLLQMVKTRFSNREENDAQTAGPTPFKSVFFYCNSKSGDLHLEIDTLVAEIRLLGVDIEVDYPPDPYSFQLYVDEESYWH